MLRTESHVMRLPQGKVPYDNISDGTSTSYNVPLVSLETSNDQIPAIIPLGQPARKKRIHATDLVAIAVSWVCLVLAIVAVKHESSAWHLGRGNAQLVVLGFLLSIMNLCLMTVAPTCFLLVEARFGTSTLQNYDGILRNQILASRLSLHWRSVLGLMLALPLGLSVAYKTFQGGESAITVNASTYVANASYYGMFAPPGLQNVGKGAGPLLFANATIPFLTATSQTDGIGMVVEPSFPTSSQTYGPNILILGNQSTAVLDLPQPRYVREVQRLLALGESWTVNASVIGTVTALDNLKTENSTRYAELYNTTCVAATASSWAYDNTIGQDERQVALLTVVARNNQSLQFIGLVPGHNGALCRARWIFDNLVLFGTNRQLCQGAWSITRGGIELIEGSCSGIALPPVRQRVITQPEHDFFLTAYYMPSLRDNLIQFALKRNGSAWYPSYLATSVAVMLWSRITALEGAENIVATNPLPLDQIQTTRNTSSDDDSVYTYQDVGLLYHVDDHIKYIRPTLRPSGWLIVVLAAQPVLCLIMYTVILCLHSVPLDNGFGLVSILSGVQSESLAILGGAALSGKLKKRATLAVRPIERGQQGTISYHIEQASKNMRHRVLNRSIRPEVTYH